MRVNDFTYKECDLCEELFPLSSTHHIMAFGWGFSGNFEFDETTKIYLCPRCLKKVKNDIMLRFDKVNPYAKKLVDTLDERPEEILDELHIRKAEWEKTHVPDFYLPWYTEGLRIKKEEEMDTYEL